MSSIIACGDDREALYCGRGRARAGSAPISPKIGGGHGSQVTKDL